MIQELLYLMNLLPVSATLSADSALESLLFILEMLETERRVLLLAVPLFSCINY